MILTDLYVMKHLSHRTASRWDCIASTQSYDMFEEWAQARQKDKIKRLKLYEEESSHIKAKCERKPDKVLTSPKGNHLSGIYLNMENPHKGYGDIGHTEDAILFLFSEDFSQMEVFIARGYQCNKKSLFICFCDGELDEDMERLRELAKPTNAD